MLEDGLWQKPSRPRRKEEFIPIEEVSDEDLHPDWHAQTLSPEDILIRSEDDDVREDIAEAKAHAEHQKKINSEERYEWMDREENEDYRKQLKGAIERYERSIADVAEPAPRKEGIKTSGSEKPAQGYRGKEPRYKNKKGAASVRRHDSLGGK